MVYMEYVDATGQRSCRTISPREVRRFRGELILIAHCHLRDERRNFKVDRIVRLTKLDAVQPPHPIVEGQTLGFPAID